MLRSYLVLYINVKTNDGKFPYTECGMTKLLQEFSMAKFYMNMQCLQSVHDVFDKCLCIPDLHWSFSSIHSKRNSISFTMKKIS